MFKIVALQIEMETVKVYIKTEEDEEEKDAATQFFSRRHTLHRACQSRKVSMVSFFKDLKRIQAIRLCVALGRTN